MKKDYLLPVGFKKIGWILLLPSVLLGCYMLFLQDKLNWLDSLNEHLLNNTALIGTAIGLIFIGFAREHNEDEMITSLRLNSLFISVYANYILLILLALCFYDFEFLTCRLNVIHIRNSKCVVDNIRGRAPVLVYLQTYTACLYLLLKSCDVA